MKSDILIGSVKMNFLYSYRDTPLQTYIQIFLAYGDIVVL